MGKCIYGILNLELRDELLNEKIFLTSLEHQVLMEDWKSDYNRIRPHSGLTYRPMAIEAIMPLPEERSLILNPVKK